MTKKWILLLAAFTAISFCTAYFPNGNAEGRQMIRGEAYADILQSAIINDITAKDEDQSGNQTVSLKNPTFKEMKNFILDDTTSQRKFIINEYECRHFATDVNNNADAAGIRCAFALLCYRNGQHAVVAFETTDRGMIYIEPQTDAAVEPEVGGYYQGQEILEILVSW